MRRCPLLAVPTLGLLAAATCSSAGDTTGRSVQVTATESSCEVTQTNLAAGRTTFAINDAGTSVTEVYVYGPGDDVKGERENIGPGTTRTLTVTLSPGSYQVACKPGMKGSGIRTPITVVG